VCVCVCVCACVCVRGCGCMRVCVCVCTQWQARMARLEKNNDTSEGERHDVMNLKDAGTVLKVETLKKERDSQKRQ